MNYLKHTKSYSYCTSNENGMQEVKVEYENGLIRSLLKKPNRVLVLVARKNSVDWFNKENGDNSISYFSIAEQVKRIAHLHNLEMK